MMACEQEKGMVAQIMSSHPEWFESITNNLEEYQIQILYTQINRDAENKPSFLSYTYNLDDNRYFYPASTIKLPVALLALERLNELQVDSLDMHTPMFTDSLEEWQVPALIDTSSESGLPSIANYIKKILLVSDNDAYNRLYEFLGQDYINQKLNDKGYKNTRIIHRLEQQLSEEQNQVGNQVRFVKDGRLIYQKAQSKSKGKYFNDGEITLGKGEIIGGELIQQPKDFSSKNKFSIHDMQQMLRAILFPESVPYFQRFNLSERQIAFVKRWMSTLPNEVAYPKLDTTQYFESYAKFFMFGDSRKPVPKNVRIFNKVGDAYGFLIDNAYIVDAENGIEFMLTACISVNKNKIYNDDQYEYLSIGFPFMANLGRAMYAYEKDRPRSYKPILETLDYTK